MLELIVETTKVLASWPVVNGFFLIVISFLGIMAIRKGDKDRKSLGSVEIPYFLMGGPVVDMMGAVHDMAEESRKQTGLLQRLVDQMDDMDHQRETTQKLLEEIRNYQALGSSGPGRRRL